MNGQGGQCSLYNFEIMDPFDAPSLKRFLEQFRSLHGRNPSAADLSAYYDRHPAELARRRKSGKV